ncbi:MAG TPA: efflux RND transporter permease subunit [Gemmatimonadales bacterium]|nr:efflux RND transporter permease subunit [Gemmatimonadales bacterium]
MAHPDDRTIIETTHNTARYFTEKRQVAWVALIGTVLWGIIGYFSMPQRKDPDIPVISALVITPWPGMDAERVEERITRRIEEVVAENSNVDVIRSTTRTGASFVYIDLKEGTTETGEIFDDIAIKLDAIDDLPEGAGPIQFMKDFGSTSALMLTVASPRLDTVQVSLRADQVRTAIESLRTGAPAGRRATLVYNFPPSISAVSAVRPTMLYLAEAVRAGVFRDARLLQGPQFVGVDGITDLDDAALLDHVRGFVEDRLRVSELHPDAWQAAVIRDPAQTTARLLAAAGDKYSYRELDDFTELMKRTFQTVDQVSKVDRSGVLDEQVTLSFSQERVASYGVPLGRLRDILKARNTALSGGVMEVGSRKVALNPTGEFRDEREIGGVIIGSSQGGAPLYLRDLVDIDRGYESPPRYLNFYTWPDTAGQWNRGRAITLSLQMRPGEKIGEFARVVDSTIAVLRDRLPPDLVMARTSDQPLQVQESVNLFMSSLWEAVALVVIVALIGFWEWRSATLLALSIPLTLAMTFGMMSVLGIDLQQISIASLIIALGLLVDDPVVAGDAIKRDLDHGHPPIIASWLGPTKLAHAIFYATITNIVAYLPLLLLSGTVGQFLFSLPVVLTCSLVASRLVSMTFIPLLGYYLLRPSRKSTPPIAERRNRGFTGWYYRLGRRAIEHRWRFAAASVVVLILGFGVASRLKPQYFPKDLQYLSYVEVWLPEDAPLVATRETTEQVEGLIRKHAAEFFAHYESGHGEGGLVSLTTFMGGGGPRFWNSFSPEPRQTNYALIVMQTRSKHDTPGLVPLLQDALSREVTGARIDVRELESGPSVGTPVSIRISGDHMPTLRVLSAQAMEIFRRNPMADRIQNDWGAESFAVDVAVDPDRANQAGLTNADVAASTAIGLNGLQLTSMHEGDRTVPVIARLRMEERARLGDLRNLYVYSSQGTEKVTLRQIASLTTGMRPEKIMRRNQFRTITIGAFPRTGYLPSEVMATSKTELDAFATGLPPGIKFEIAGEQEAQQDGFGELATIMGISIGLIFLALAVQFQNAVKPLLVFGAIPYGFVGAFVGLWIMGQPFGFMAFLGIVSLVGVIVSHVIVLFDFIEEARERGETLEDALLDAGIVRLRPVLITVGATVFALVPLAMHGGPLWEPLCYTQIGGLAVATVITLLLVPVFYSIAVLDLKIVKWVPGDGHEGPAGSHAGG